MIVVLSDLHLGLNGAPDPRELAPLFEGATRVILNGDATELSTPQFAARAHANLNALVEHIRAAGAEPTLLAGNHDPGVSPHLHCTLQDGRVLVTHGHAFHPMIVPWSSFAQQVSAAHRAAWDAHPELPPLERALQATAAAAACERRIDLAQPPLRELVSTALRPTRMFQIIGYWRIFPELAVRFRDACAPECNVIVSGHSHRAGAWWVRGCLVLNTGCFTFPGTPHAALLQDDEIVLVPLQRHRAGWRYRAEVRRVWRISEIAAAAASARTPVS